jgi:hypothetical protein
VVYDQWPYVKAHVARPRSPGSLSSQSCCRHYPIVFTAVSCAFVWLLCVAGGMIKTTWIGRKRSASDVENVTALWLLFRCHLYAHRLLLQASILFGLGAGSQGHTMDKALNMCCRHSKEIILMLLNISLSNRSWKKTRNSIQFLSLSFRFQKTVS